jgi:plastocyanin
MKNQLVLAVAFISIGVVGLIAVACQAQTFAPYSNPQAPFGNSQGFGFPGGMMGGGMMGPGGMMGGGYPYGYAPSAIPTPVPANVPIDREIKITARNLRFDPARVVVEKGETVRFMIANQDAAPHNFVSQDGNIAYTFLPANATQAVVWVAPEKGTYVVLCTYHAGMQMQIVVE